MVHPRDQAAGPAVCSLATIRWRARGPSGARVTRRLGAGGRYDPYSGDGGRAVDSTREPRARARAPADRRRPTTDTGRRRGSSPARQLHLATPGKNRFRGAAQARSLAPCPAWQCVGEDSSRLLAALVPAPTSSPVAAAGAVGGNRDARARLGSASWSDRGQLAPHGRHS